MAARLTKIIPKQPQPKRGQSKIISEDTELTMAAIRRRRGVPRAEIEAAVESGQLRVANTPLTEQQTRFVKHYVHDKMNISAAARLAGYNRPATTGQDLLKSPKVIAAITREREEYAKASGLTKKKVIDGFLEAIDMARTMSDPVAMIGGWREVGKMCGFYEPQKREVSISVNGQVMIQKIQSLTDEELLQLAENEPDALTGEFSVLDE